MVGENECPRFLDPPNPKVLLESVKNEGWQQTERVASVTTSCLVWTPCEVISPLIGSRCTEMLSFLQCSIGCPHCCWPRGWSSVWPGQGPPQSPTMLPAPSAAPWAFSGGFKHKRSFLVSRFLLLSMDFHYHPVLRGAWDFKLCRWTSRIPRRQP